MQEATEKRTETYVEARMDERITLGTDLSYSPPIIVGEHDVARESILDEKDRENSETKTGPTGHGTLGMCSTDGV